MFLSDKNKSTRTKKAKPVRRQVLRNEGILRSNQKQHIANQILRVRSPSQFLLASLIVKR